MHDVHVLALIGFLRVEHGIREGAPAGDYGRAGFFLDIALAYALINFIATTALLRYPDLYTRLLADGRGDTACQRLLLLDLVLPAVLNSLSFWCVGINPLSGATMWMRCQAGGRRVETRLGTEGSAAAHFPLRSEAGTVREPEIGCVHECWVDSEGDSR